MPTKFKTGNAWGTPWIKAVEILRETEMFVFLPRDENRTGRTERREAKDGEWGNYHDTWEAAHAFLLARTTAAVENARRELAVAHDKLGNVKGMKPPADSAA